MKKIEKCSYKMSLWILLIIGLCTATGAPVQAYTVITLGSGVPTSLEKDLIARTTTQFNAVLTVNPLVANTYQIKILGPNPSYSPPATAADLLKVLPVFPYASGMMYERNNDASKIGFTMSLCDNATNFMNTNLASWDPTTCNAALGYTDNWIVFQTSGLAVVPDPLVGF